MPDIQVTQSSFTEGELSPRFIGQTNNQNVFNGLTRNLNSLSLPQGPVRTRPGTQRLELTEFSAGDNITMWPFIDPDNREIVAVFTEFQVQLYDPISGVIGGNPSPYSILNENWDFTLSNGAGWTFQPTYYINASEYFLWLSYAVQPSHYFVLGWEFDTGGAVVTFPIGTTILKPFLEQVTSVTDADNVQLVIKEAFASNNTKPGFAARALVKLGTTEGGNDLGEITYFYDPVTSFPGGEQPIRTIQAPLIPNGPNGYTGEVWIRYELVLDEPAGNQTFSTLTFWELHIDYIQLFVQPFAVATTITETTPYSNDEINDLHFVQSPFNDKELIVLHPNHPPQKLFINSGTLNWDFDVYDISPYPAEWTGTDWPSVGAGFEGRLWLSGVPSVPEKIFASASLNWKLFSPTGSNPGDPMTLTAQARTVNTWLFGFKRMLFGDIRAEYEITSQQGPITPGDASARVQSGFGSLRMPQKTLQDKYILLHGAGNTDFRMLHYSDENGGFVAPNVSLKAEHLGKREFKRSFYVREPHQMMWNIMHDGTVTVLNFDDSLNFTAWSQLDFGGEVIDGCVVIDENGNNVIMLAVKRVTPFATNIYLERITDLRFVSRWFAMDNVQTIFGVDMVGGIVGFDDLDGSTVSVFADDQYIGNQQVHANAVVIPYPAQKLTVGIPFTFEVQTFPFSVPDPSTGLTAKKRFSKAGVRGVFSLPPVINGQRPPDRDQATVMNASPSPLDIYDAEVITEGTTEYTAITVSEPLPFPVTIAAIYGKLTGNQL